MFKFIAKIILISHSSYSGIEASKLSSLSRKSCSGFSPANFVLVYSYNGLTGFDKKQKHGKATKIERVHRIGIRQLWQ